MLDLNLPLSSVLELHPRKAAEFCETALEMDQLVDSLDSGRPFARKTLCEYLGIGESTLSGWIKDGRIPRMAKNAIVLLMAQQQLAAEVRRLRASDLYVVQSGDHFLVSELREDDDGELVGRVLADHIATIEDARLLASGRRALRVLQNVENSGVFDYVHDMSENEPFIAGVQAAEDQIESHRLYLTDYPSWQKQFGKQSPDSQAKTAAGPITAPVEKQS